MNIIIQIIIAFFITDILAGFFHWFEDRYIDYCTNIPIIKDIAEDNELHHYFPRAILAYSYAENMIITTIIAIIIIFFVFIINSSLLVEYKYFFISFFIFSSITNVIHRISHLRDCETNEFIKFLQKIGLLSNHEYHAVHHETANTRFCPATIYTNFIFDSLHIWEFIEHIIYFFTGIKAKPHIRYDLFYPIHDYRHLISKLDCPDRPTKNDVKELKQKLIFFKNCKK